MSGAGGELVGDGPGVAGHVRRVLVDLVEEEPQCAGDGAGAGGLEGDGDGGWGGGGGWRGAAAAGAQQGELGFGVDLVGGEPGGDFAEGGLCCGGPAFGCGDCFLGGRDQPGVLGRGGDRGGAERGGEG